ncbi:Rgp1-domain-containing protein [Teratosphaeria destructans]|uniref:Rgp1-domain-containing protein n=1 Tax=Teratosphaeria destructans TaxID=418781 RepID=A0A9W7W4B7_9PEZI|nr:Rgp1-domain-containing protein [Teratosphaeria destructans]
MPPHPSPASGLTRQPSPLHETATHPPPPPPHHHAPAAGARPGRRRPGTVSAGNTPRIPDFTTTADTGHFEPTFHFPPKPSPPKIPAPKLERPKQPPRNPSTMHSAQHRGPSPRPADLWSPTLGTSNPITRVLSASSVNGTPRSSSEFYSMSNRSDETLTSELPTHYQPNGRLLPKRSPTRQGSRSPHDRHGRPPEPETLMMAYAQTMGHFTLDGSLVNAAPFEEVKRKGAQSSGGVVGIESSSSKRTSGMFGAFSWGNLGESLSGLLGADDVNGSSMAQMKASTDSRAVPLLSTPQSLLFVDLRLAPGESRSYTYRFPVPRGLPPSHRGRALKVHYHLVIGVQRPGGQAVKRVEIPFRVLGSYNSRGETLGHDLMSPYILLHDAARTSSIAPSSSPTTPTLSFSPKRTEPKGKPAKQGLEDFLRYTERLLERAETDQSAHLLSPTSPTNPHNIPNTPTTTRQRSESDFQPQPTSIKEAIDLAILRSNQPNHSPTSKHTPQSATNRFNIARSGQPVAVLTLLRPAFRLGEAVIGTIDFTTPPRAPNPPQAPTYNTLVELESVEKVDPSLALRSTNSITRVTRKIHATQHDNALFARTIPFALSVPAAATPTFETTGVSLAWTLRVTFMVQRQGPRGLDEDQQGGEGGEEELLEELGTDERGTVLIARERLAAETFEVVVPIRVFGAPGVGVDGGGGGGGEGEGVQV